VNAFVSFYVHQPITLRWSTCNGVSPAPRRGYTGLCVVTRPWIAFSIRLACGAVVTAFRRGGDGGELVVRIIDVLLGLLLLGLLILLGDLLI